MNKRILLVTAIAVIVVLVLSVIFSQTGLFGPAVDNTVPSVTPIGSKIERPKTYQEFVKSGRSEICTFSSRLNDGTRNGTVYAASGKIRTDFTIAGPKGTLQVHFVVDSYTGYLWNNVNKNGVKFPVTELDKNDNSVSLINLDCDEWVPNLAVFDLPSDITFLEITDKDLGILKQLISPTISPSNQ